MTMEEHMQKFFTDFGFDTLYSYTQTLVKEYYQRESYPFKFGIILGIPYHMNSSAERIVDSKEELKGRIKSNLQLLGLNSMTIQVKDTKITFEVKQ